MAQEEEGLLLEFEAEMRAADQVPNPRQMDLANLPTPPEAPPWLRRPVVERLQHPNIHGSATIVTKWATSRAIARKKRRERQTAMSNSQATNPSRWLHTKLTDTFLIFATS